MRRSVILLLVLLPTLLFAQSKSNGVDKFRQLEELFPTPNDYRAASGSPGGRYWQQRADYVIDVRLDDEKQWIHGKERITYWNNSPDELIYLWLQLDPNLHASDAEARTTQTAPSFDKLPYKTLTTLLLQQQFDGRMRLTSVRDGAGAALKHTVVKTMMRIDLPQPLRPGEKMDFAIEWNHPINDAKKIGGRGGYEYFPKDKNYIYEIAQWFPRLVAYTDVNGWQHKQYLGSGEFTLDFGDYDVAITVPSDHIVASTGELQNAAEVLSGAQRDRLKQADNAKAPQWIVTPQEAKANESSRSKSTKTWKYSAKNVRDFAFASSRKFIWDAQRHNVGGNNVLAMSYYPNEAEPLWSRYSTRAIVHTLNVYSRYTFPYPYPVAISVNGPVGGMEYPMICFNGPRPEDDKTYTKNTKYGLISVVIHEVGHNFFPMIVNSDERQWTWMDEGLNTFLQHLSEVEWEDDYPSGRGEPKNVVAYMISSEQVPIMTNSESILQFGNNAYHKPATALNILRESILGRELFDFSFKEYARRWKFRRPQPADFFRTMEDASGVDLDWFWRGWFYTTDHNDVSVERVRELTMDTRDPAIDKPARKAERDSAPETLAQSRNEKLEKVEDVDPSVKDFYNTYDDLDVTAKDRKAYEELLKDLTDEEKALLKSDMNFYVVDLRNIGGLVMPVVMLVEYGDGTKEELRIPAEIWRRNSSAVSKLILTKKEVKSVQLDPHLETADADLDNNYWPRRPVKSRFQLFKEEKKKNPMQELEKKP